MANAEPLHGPSHVHEDQCEQWGIFSAAASLPNAQTKTSSLFSSAEERNGPYHEQPWGPESMSGSGVAVYCTSERVRMKASNKTLSCTLSLHPVPPPATGTNPNYPDARFTACKLGEAFAKINLSSVSYLQLPSDDLLVPL
ncbi:hypothetical protein FVEG_04073 [Fusarium verticillioides 7600]|uniref:Uncharacterized protein n=1 Tax=Gibberella moniliformis (strain M3125 / FGSC 7600) TaxID=334819 RepID=W7LU91_GIBM7|nr:hypothetical protein FVEG_04073 [Fusarium verticillioides 7600]EWG42151.1 hypothetical protein FVEG_04073 [Fusarium verticillioides 7600]